MFQGYGEGKKQAGGPNRRIHHQHQTIIPSYKFNCCGNITEWGVDLNPDGTSAEFDFILQVWRPAPTVGVSGCYSLVDNFVSIKITVEDNPANERVARVTPSLQDQLEFQPGDVLGFYVESNGDGNSDHDNGVVVLNSDDQNQSYNELVWFAKIQDTSLAASQSGSCPYPVGTNGVLNSSTHAAPVISISITSYFCPESVSLLSLSTSVKFVTPIQSLITSALIVTTAQKDIRFECPSNHCGLLVGAVVTTIVVCLFTLIIMIATIIIKKCKKNIQQYL